MRIIPENPGNEYRTAYLYEKNKKIYNMLHGYINVNLY